MNIAENSVSFYRVFCLLIFSICLLISSGWSPTGSLVRPGKSTKVKFKTSGEKIFKLIGSFVMPLLLETPWACRQLLEYPPLWFGLMLFEIFSICRKIQFPLLNTLHQAALVILNNQLLPWLNMRLNIGQLGIHQLQ